MNTNAARAIVEQTTTLLFVHWYFILLDEEGTEVHRGVARVTKADAMADRDKMIRQACDTRPEYRDPVLRVAMRAVYLTRDPSV